MIAYCLGQLCRFPHCVDALPAPPDEGQAQEHGLSGSHLYGNPRARLQYGRLQLRLWLCPRGHEGAHGEGVDLKVLHDAKYPIPLHAYAAFFAVILGAVQFLLPKS